MASRKSFILAFFIALAFSSMTVSLAARHLLQLPTLPPLPSIPNLPQPTLPTLPPTQPSLPKPTLPPLPSIPTIPTIPTFLSCDARRAEIWKRNQHQNSLSDNSATSKPYLDKLPLMHYFMIPETAIRKVIILKKGYHS
ncbi:hypothetical protein POTOM_054729 [Populus tomentosa]|uniref:Hydroxyproline-rich glycoprotein family protein n=1 Tax=Populus tomentosa TaxID=118781 RepID=A0A8X8C3F3_POPTO|nr:hypothetical protein POTOM_054729 [Populus tomentosa]